MSVDLKRFVNTCLSGRAAIVKEVETIHRYNQWGHLTANDWTFQELVGHLLWYEIQMIHVLTEKNLGDHSYWGLSHQDRNIKINEKYAKYTSDQLMDEFRKVGNELKRLLTELDPTELNDPEKFDMPPDWKPYDILDQNLVGHYREHIKYLKQNDV